MTDLSHISLRQCWCLDMRGHCVTNKLLFHIAGEEMVNSQQQLMSERQAVVAPCRCGKENAKWLGLIEEFAGRRDVCLTALCAYFEKGKT